MRFNWASLSLSTVFFIVNQLFQIQAKCVITQKCLNPGNLPDYDACIPEAYPTPVNPQPVCIIKYLVRSLDKHANEASFALDDWYRMGKRYVDVLFSASEFLIITCSHWRWDLCK
jgi:hypothetical protein